MEYACNGQDTFYQKALLRASKGHTHDGVNLLSVEKCELPE